jgi:hypothetical protein
VPVPVLVPSVAGGPAASAAEARAGHGHVALPAKVRQPVGALPAVTAKLFMLLAGGAMGSSWIHRSSAL